MSASEAGVIVTDEKALAVATFYACLRVLTSSLGSTPLPVYRRLGEQGKERARDNYWYPVLHDAPNNWQTPAEWKALGMMWLVLRGNFYCEVQRGFGLAPTLLVPLNADRVQPIIVDTGRLTYRYRPPDGPPRVYAADQILHVRGLSLDGVQGVSVLTYARNALGLAVAQETHGSKLFANGSLPPFALETPEIMNQQAIGNFRAGWRGMHAGSKNAYNPPILQGGMKIHELALTNEDSQWLESRRFEAEEICRFMGVPPHMAGILDRATFSNIEQQGMEFVRYTLRPWCTLWQQAIQRDLLQDDELFAEFLLDDLQRGDTASRYGAYSVGLQSGFLTRNEVRSWENLNPLPGGDRLMEPLNMAPLGQRQEEAQSTSQAETREDEDEDEDDIQQSRVRRRKRKRRQSTEEARRMFTPLVEDVARRIATREYRGLVARVNRAAEDVDRWREWASCWYETHQAAAEEVLHPLATGWLLHTGHRVAVAEACHRLRTDGLRQLTERDPQQVLDEWKEVRAQQTAALLAKELR
jgi:HK97 family phage portal protein